MLRFQDPAIQGRPGLFLRSYCISVELSTAIVGGNTREYEKIYSLWMFR